MKAIAYILITIYNIQESEATKIKLRGETIVKYYKKKRPKNFSL